MREGRHAFRTGSLANLKTGLSAHLGNLGRYGAFCEPLHYYPVVPDTKETAMRKQLAARWHAFIELLLGGSQSFQPLPEAYHETPDWLSASKSLQLPAAWRRQRRLR